MQWEEIRNRYPHQWLLVEAIKAHSEADKRILEQISVISTYPDSVMAMQGYTQLHHEAPERELYFARIQTAFFYTGKKLSLCLRAVYMFYIPIVNLLILPSGCG
ncbi:MAG: hypothetical protein L6R45_13050 [Anaerolineae bacterium]|nr:hypothetical protein [Anaerolineae bacterium]